MVYCERLPVPAAAAGVKLARRDRVARSRMLLTRPSAELHHVPTVDGTDPSLRERLVRDRAATLLSAETRAFGRAAPLRGMTRHQQTESLTESRFGSRVTAEPYPLEE